MRIGITYKNKLITSIGDSLGLSVILEAYYRKYGQRLIVSSTIPELFYGNPYIDGTTIKDKVDIRLRPCLNYDCKIIDYYKEQMGLDIDERDTPRIHLKDIEILEGMDKVIEFKDSKKIVVVLNTNGVVRNIDFDFIQPLLQNLKDNGHKLIVLGNDSVDNEIYDKSFINQTTIREAAAIIKNCDLYLGVDCGLYHLAAAVGVPQVVFFRNNGSSINSYYNTSFVDHEKSCPPECKTRHLTQCKSKRKCMREFDLDQYYEIIEEALVKNYEYDNI